MPSFDDIISVYYTINNLCIPVKLKSYVRNGIYTFSVFDFDCIFSTVSLSVGYLRVGLLHLTFVALAHRFTRFFLGWFISFACCFTGGTSSSAISSALNIASVSHHGKSLASEAATKSRIKEPKSLWIFGCRMRSIGRLAATCRTRWMVRCSLTMCTSLLVFGWIRPIESMSSLNE